MHPLVAVLEEAIYSDLIKSVRSIVKQGLRELEMDSKVRVLPSYSTRIAQVRKLRRSVGAEQVYQLRFNPRALSDYSDEVIIGVIGHELGHVWEWEDGREWSGSWGKELQADRVGGFLLGKLCAPLEPSVRLLKKIAKVPTTSHPPAHLRIKAMLQGWRTGFEVRDRS